ncbi:MFS transporter [Nocardioides carbamazepini]|uniref:MFS transporter n=1 Tax=Nocardioides carbamazepini TaxID=2854259 RepID=UPI002149DE4A|nr:MFS transporter [Nocardioides carbamazepini]MCR1785127.1 MFS transporter [Nocardioides carbamazepini]
MRAGSAAPGRVGKLLACCATLRIRSGGVGVARRASQHVVAPPPCQIGANRRSRRRRASRPALAGYLAADAVSLAGTRLSQIAVPWLVLTTTGSAAKTGLVAFAGLLPLVLAQALCGPWIDRAGPRRVAIGFDLASGVAVATIPLAYAAGWLHFPVLLALVAVTGLLRGPSEAARHAMVPALVRHVALPTERVTGLVGTTDRLSALVGAAVGGGLVALLGPVTALLVDAGSFVACAVVLAVSTRRVGGAAPGRSEPGRSETVRPARGERATSYLAELRGGWLALRRDPVLLGMMVMVAVTNLLDQGYSSVMLPVWAEGSGGGPAAIGLLGACMGGAALVGSVLATWRAERLPRFRTYVVGYLLAGAPRWVVLALGCPLWLVALVHVIAGFGAGFINPVLGAVQFERIPEDLMGRVSSLSLAASWSLMPLGGLLAGLAVGGTGLAAGLLLFGAAYLVTTMAPVLSPSWRDIDRRPLPDQPSGAAEAANASTAARS